MSYPAGSLVLSDVKLGIYNWVANSLAGVVKPGAIIWRNQSQPLPPRPCVTMKIISGPSPTDRNPSSFSDPTSNAYTLGMQMEMMVSVQVFGSTKVPNSSAHQITLDLNSSLFKQSILDNLKSAGVSIQSKGQVQNLTALEETEYEERFGFEISMGLVQNIVDEPGIIENVNVDVTVTNVSVTTPERSQSFEIVLP